MAAKLSLLSRAAPPPPPVAMSPERIKLAEAIAARAEAKAQADALQTAVANARGEVISAMGAVDRARADLEEAPRRYAEALTAKAMGDATAVPVPAREMAERLAEAERHLEAARESRMGLEKVCADAEARVMYSAPKVKAAALAVLATSAAIPVLVAEVEALQRAYVDKALALDWLRYEDIVNVGTRASAGGWSDITPAFTISNRFTSPPRSWHELTDNPSVTGAGPWREALAALQRDASAPVPE